VPAPWSAARRRAGLDSYSDAPETSARPGRLQGALVAGEIVRMAVGIVHEDGAPCMRASPGRR
jgi:hypothetical protein